MALEHTKNISVCPWQAHATFYDVVLVVVVFSFQFSTKTFQKTLIWSRRTLCGKGISLFEPAHL